jgi:hypothetical protein
MKKRSLFEQIAIPYLAANPFYDFALERLGLTFVDWLEKHYCRRDRNHILTGARIDHAFRALASLPKEPTAIQFTEKTKLFLQPRILLFETPGNFLGLREQIVKQRKSITKDPIKAPSKINSDEKTEYFVLFCDSNEEILCQTLSYEHFILLKMFKEGLSFQEAHFFFRNKCYPSFIDLLSLDETLEGWKEREFFTLSHCISS